MWEDAAVEVASLVLEEPEAFISGLFGLELVEEEITHLTGDFVWDSMILGLI